MACGAPSEEEFVGSVAEPAVLLKPPKHFSGEPEYPVEGGPPKLDLPPPWDGPPNQQGPEYEPYQPPTYEPPTYEPPDPDPHNGIDPYEHANPHRNNESGHSNIPRGPNAGDDMAHNGSTNETYAQRAERAERVKKDLQLRGLLIQRQFESGQRQRGPNQSVDQAACSFACNRGIYEACFAFMGMCRVVPVLYITPYVSVPCTTLTAVCTANLVTGSVVSRKACDTICSAVD
jgi:hypothetical protein